MSAKNFPSSFARSRRVFRLAAGLAAFGFIAWFVHAFEIYESDPFSSLPLAEKDLQAAVTQNAPVAARRSEHVVLHGKGLGDIGLTISLPDPLPAGKMPVLIVLGGLGTGQENIDFLQDLGANVLVGYDWPLPQQFPKLNSISAQLQVASMIPDLYRRVMNVPGQVASGIDWIDRQPWADGTRISLLGFSLGALVLPASEDVAERAGTPVGWSVIAYGGAPLGAVVASTIANSRQHFWYGSVLPRFADLLLSPLEPTRHLPYLKSRFLVLEGQNDERFPEALRMRLREAVPDPKRVVVLQGQHLGLQPKKLPILDEVIDISKTWLIETGAADAP